MRFRSPTGLFAALLILALPMSADIQMTLAHSACTNSTTFALIDCEWQGTRANGSPCTHNIASPVVGNCTTVLSFKDRCVDDPTSAPAGCVWRICHNKSPTSDDTCQSLSNFKSTSLVCPKQPGPGGGCTPAACF